jgi:Flp pilus assembly protein protease CpaA
MKSLLFTAILSLRKRSEQLLIKFAILLQVRLTHAQTFFRGVAMGMYKLALEAPFDNSLKFSGVPNHDISVNYGKT